MRGETHLPWMFLGRKVRPFAFAVTGATAPGDDALPRAYADAGATWWFECLFASRGSHADMLARINAGPPRA